MNTALTSQAPSRAAIPAQRLTFSPRIAFGLQASITLAFLAGSSAPTPLYAIYRAHWGFSPTLLTVVFAVYALAVLASLLVLGRLSDHVGRRPVLIGATIVQALTMVVFATASSVGDLLVARTLQGLSAGAAIAAVGAGLLDLDKTRGAVANSVAPMLGTAIGGAIAGLFVQFLPAPTRLVYEVLGAVFIAQAVALCFIAETAPPRAGALASLRPRLALPQGARGTFLRVAPAVVAVWALAGFYAALGPTLVARLLDGASMLTGGLALFVVAGSGALAVLATRQRDARTLMRIGASALVIGLLGVLVAVSLRSIAVFLLASAVAGIGFGTGFQGALRSLVARIDANERAGTLAVLFVLSYLAMGAPAVAAGYHLSLHGDIVGTTRAFAAAVIALALAAGLATIERAGGRA
ncbi:MFS transporter [Variovorax sp. GT1P44]|uniref:MFS transporter n=1 Tax=Variovorax sp. GT1P44 TaxID=3443742 RepID=UPI003F48E87A